MIKRFKINKNYSTRSICDYNCIFNFIIVKRSEKNLWINDGKKIVRKKIHVYDNEEIVFPLGQFSMAPILRAS